MTGLARTDLATPERAHLAATAIAGQGRWGAVTEAAAAFGVSRDTVYSAREQGMQALSRHFGAGSRGVVNVPVRRAQLDRTIVALRVTAPTSIRAIERALPLIYPGVSASYGYIQGVLAEAERRAAQFNASVDMSAVDAVALDEMFSQGAPVLAGVDLDRGLLTTLQVSGARGGDEWAAALGQAREQGMDPYVVVKDAARGIAAGVTAVFPGADQRDDAFHALHEMGKAARKLESAAWAAIAAEYRIEDEIAALPVGNKSVTGTLKSLRGKLTKARRDTQRRAGRFDDFCRARAKVREAMELVDLKAGALREPKQMRAAIKAGGEAMKQLGHAEATRVGKYIVNRTDGLESHAEEAVERLHEVACEHSLRAVELAAVVVRLTALARRSRPWRESAHADQLIAAFALLSEHPSGMPALELVEDIFLHRHRANSAIEGFNAALRPHLYVHKRATQGFLELFRAWFNLRRRRWGRHKGTSPYELLTGEPVNDWLELLGYPRAPSVH